jgi:hypothetical protein
MSLSTFATLYLAAATFVAAYAFHHGVVLRRRTRLLSANDQVLLSLVACGVGLAWILFMPGLAVHSARQLIRFAQRQRGWVWGVARQVRARV